MPLLEVDRLMVRFDTPDGEVEAVNGISFSLERSEVLAIVGESGSGKSQTVLSIMGLLAANGRCSGSVRYRGEEILNLPADQLNRYRGDRISMIFQQPQSSLNPVFTLGDQLAEVFHIHRDIEKKEAWDRSVELLRLVGIPDPEQKAYAYPHEMSGGQAQRVMIAMALALNPQLLLADEPTTALDVTIQAQILQLLLELKKTQISSVLLITHDLGIVAKTCQRVGFMYAGNLCEVADVRELFSNPRHPYTQALLAAVPKFSQEGQLKSIDGNVPNLVTPPPGCRFHPRCDQAKPDCRKRFPADFRWGERTREFAYLCLPFRSSLTLWGRLVLTARPMAM